MLSLPKRSPDFNLMDYSAWSEVERRLRAQEKKFPATMHETRAEFTRRLDRASRNIPKQFIDKSISDLHQRCEHLCQAKGVFFEESVCAKLREGSSRKVTADGGRCDSSAAIDVLSATPRTYVGNGRRYADSTTKST